MNASVVVLHCVVRWKAGLMVAGVLLMSRAASKVILDVLARHAIG